MIYLSDIEHDLEFVDLPTVPSYLLESVESIIERPFKKGTILLDTKSDFKARDISKDLRDWIQSIVDFPIFAKYQLIYPAIPIHKDPQRKLAYNYILEPGGSEVVTTVYDEDYNPTSSLLIPAFKWCRLKTAKYHGVRGILPNKIRVALSFEPVLVFD